MTAKTYSCPKCWREVTTTDTNVAKDIMLCPLCGEVSSFSEVIGAARDEEGVSTRRIENRPKKGGKR